MANRKALGAALTTLGGVMQENRLEKEEQRRREEMESKEERRLQIAEQDAEQRRELNRIQINMAKAEWDTQQIKKACISSDWDPDVVGKAWSDYGNTGYHYSFNKTKSEQSPDGTWTKIVYDIGTVTKKGGGVEGVGGVPTIQKLGTEGQEKVFLPGKDENGNDVSAIGQVTRHTSKMVNPNFSFSMIEAKVTGEQRQQEALKFEQMKAATAEETAQGKRKAEKEGLDIKEQKLDIEAKQAKNAAGVGDKGESVIDSLDGTRKVRSKEESQNDRAVFDKATKQWGSVSSIAEASRINETKDNPDIRKLFTEDIKAVLKDPSRRKEIREQWKADGLNGEYFDAVMQDAEMNKEDWLEVDKKPNIFKRTWDKIFK